MMSQSRILLALALANSVSAFLLPANPGRLGVQSAHPEVVAKVRMAATDPASAPPAAPPADPIPDPFPAYPGLKLPYGEEMPVGSQDNANEKVNDEVIPFLTGIVGFWMAQIAGKDKSDLSSLDPLQKFVADGLRKHNEAAVPDLADMPEGFKFFGGDDLAAQLCVLLESNPFYAASLTPRDGGGFEIINFVCHTQGSNPRALPYPKLACQPCSSHILSLAFDRTRSPKTRRTTSRSCAR
jgi:hypothetical protein